MPEHVLASVLAEVEGILNAKPLGYGSTDAANPNTITPHILLMGRHDSSLPQALNDSSSILGTRRWRHSQVLTNQLLVNLHPMLPAKPPEANKMANRWTSAYGGPGNTNSRSSTSMSALASWQSK